MRPFRFLAFVPTIIVLAVITYLSLAKNPVHSQGADKLVHGCMYLGLVWIGCFDIYRVSKFTAPKLILLVCGAIVWGGLMELLQGAMSMGRSADWYDFLANSCGAILGLILGANSVPYLFKKCKKLS
jgi:VanZ family protein